MKKRILLTYCMYGNGHHAIAEYIERYFKEQDAELEIMAIDLLCYATPILGRISKKMSEFLVLKFPLGWSFVYDIFNTKASSAIASRGAMRIFKNKRIKKVISDFNPDLTISTHFFGSCLIDYYNRKNIICSKLITVVTDYEAHHLWLKGYKKEQAIVVGDKDEVSYLVKKGVSKDKIKPIGIPIHPITEINFDVKKARLKYGFRSERPVCLFFGGGSDGSLYSFPFIKSLLKEKIEIDIIYVAGKNERARKKVEKLVREYNLDNVVVLGYVNNVPELLQLCDFVVSKPGGAQTTESLYFKKPIIMINCSGGQEVANYKYFEKNGYGKRFRTVFMFRRFIRSVARNPKVLKSMQRNMERNNNDKAMEKLYKIASDLLK